MASAPNALRPPGAELTLHRTGLYLGRNLNLGPQPLRRLRGFPTGGPGNYFIYKDIVRVYSLYVFILSIHIGLVSVS